MSKYYGDLFQKVKGFREKIKTEHVRQMEHLASPPAGEAGLAEGQAE